MQINLEEEKRIHRPHLIILPNHLRNTAKLQIYSVIVINRTFQIQPFCNINSIHAVMMMPSIFLLSATLRLK